MAKRNIWRRLVAIQIMVVTMGIIPGETGSIMKSIGQLSKSVTRSVAKLPSLVADGTQGTTHLVAKNLRNIDMIKGVVDGTCKPVANTLGTVSRALGKETTEHPSVVVLYGRRVLNEIKRPPTHEDAIKEIIGYVMQNVIMNHESMTDDTAVDISALPVLSELAQKFKKANDTIEDNYYLIKLLGSTGKDITEDLAKKIIRVGLSDGKIIENGLMDELRWIGRNLNNFGLVPHNKRDEYTMKTNELYKHCTIVHMPNP